MEQFYLSVVIPAYNEARRLPSTLAQVSNYLTQQTWTSELIIVNDGSTDETSAVVHNFIAQTANNSQSTPHSPKIRLIENDHRGKGHTVRTGMLAAQGRFILFTDADLSTPMTETAKILIPLEQGYDIAIGSREGLGAQRQNEPLLRHWMGRAFNAFVRLMVLNGINDTQCGFKAFHRDIAHKIFRQLKVYGHEANTVRGASVTAFDVEVLYLAISAGYRIAEIPVIWRYGEKSTVNPLRDSIRMARDIILMRINIWRGIYANNKQISDE